MTLGETHLVDGAGAQTDTSNRWGDYSDMTVDPVDDQTFWYTQEYYDSTSSFNWRTRIGSFKLATSTSTLKLQAVGQTQGTKHQTKLKWKPADGVGTVNVIRNGTVVNTVPDNGSTTDKLGTQTGTFIYQVCETDSGVCSNTATVTF